MNESIVAELIEAAEDIQDKAFEASYQAGKLLGKLGVAREDEDGEWVAAK